MHFLPSQLPSSCHGSNPAEGGYSRYIHHSLVGPRIDSGESEAHAMPGRPEPAEAAVGSMWCGTVRHPCSEA